MHSYKKIVLLSFLYFYCTGLSAQTGRAMYIDDFDTILNSDTLKDNLLQYADANEIDYLILYDLHTVHNQHDLTNPSTNQILADFISDAKSNHSISLIGATSENAWFIENRVMPYNATRSAASEKFDVLVMEFEFWNPNLIDTGDYYCTYYMQPNGLPCDSMGAFAFCKNELQEMDTMAMNSSHPMTVEIYVGWPNAGQLQQIADIVDRTLIHAYVTHPNTAFGYALPRLQHYATYADTADILIIFSSEPNFMGPWLSSSGLLAAEQIFKNDYHAASGTWKNQVNFQGFTYFTYSTQLNTRLPLDLLTFEVQEQAGKAVLQWKIAHAESVKNFEVEYSSDRLHFYPIGIVPFVAEQQTYFFDIEKKSVRGMGRHYFRLKIMDWDGAYAYSDIVHSAAETPLPMAVFPNPSENYIHVQNRTEKATYRIIDARGQVVLEGSICPEQLYIGDLPKGTYWIEIQGQTVFFEKI